MDKYEVYNPTQFVVSFTVIPSGTLPPIMSISSHHRRRVMKGLRHNISIQSMHSLDLCKVTGFSSEALDHAPELQQLIKRKRLVKVSEIVPPAPVPVAPVVMIGGVEIPPPCVERDVEINDSETGE